MNRSTVVIASALCLIALPSAASAATVAEWKMDEARGAGTMTDSASLGGANNGSISPGVTTGVPGLAGGSAYDFDDPQTAAVTVPDHDSLDEKPGSAGITLRATVQIDNVPMPDDSYDIVRKGVTTTRGGDWKMEVKRTINPSVGKLLCVFKGVTTGSTRVAVQRMANVDVVDGQKHTLTCIKTPTKVQAVVDGRTFTTTRNTGLIANDQPVVLGAKVQGDDVFRGVMDQVSIDIG